jgi:anti-sigma factor (TIGR02949 family)
VESLKCHQFLNSLSAYVDGDLDEELCTDIERHLQECDNCRVILDTLKKTIYLYRVITDVDTVPVDVRERLYQRLDLVDYLELNEHVMKMGN